MTLGIGSYYSPSTGALGNYLTYGIGGLGMPANLGMNVMGGAIQGTEAALMGVFRNINFEGLGGATTFHLDPSGQQYLGQSFGVAVGAGASDIRTNTVPLTPSPSFMPAPMLPPFFGR